MNWSTRAKQPLVHAPVVAAPVMQVRKVVLRATSSSRKCCASVTVKGVSGCGRLLSGESRTTNPNTISMAMTASSVRTNPLLFTMCVC